MRALSFEALKLLKPACCVGNGRRRVNDEASDDDDHRHLQMLLELEAAFGEADAPGSLMDCVLVGLITAIREFILCVVL